MNYELAKQLKDAGFPQSFKNPTHYIEADSDAKFGDVIEMSPEKFISIPTLSELIEACKVDLVLTKYLQGVYVYSAEWEEEPLEWTKFDGKTPEEAVAKLWLELNKKAQTVV